VLHGSSLLVAELEAGLSARMEGRTNLRAVGITADGKVDGVDVFLLAGGSSTVSQGLLKGVGVATLDVRVVLTGFLEGVGVRVRRVDLR
jgi:hypothetical protein